MLEKEQGFVKWFSPVKGYGFIERIDGTDIFVHFSNIVADGFKTLNENQEVEFSVENTEKGIQAIEVTAM
jgi:CspA family cold shock protein